MNKKDFKYEFLEWAVNHPVLYFISGVLGTAAGILLVLAVIAVPCVVLIWSIRYIFGI